jgi:glucose-6-phosphate dehydrogenase assembly protein OpcA
VAATVTGRELADTTAAEVSAALMAERHSTGSGTETVLTLVVDTTERALPDALAAATEAALVHPCRVLAVVRRRPGARARLDATIRARGAGNPGELAVLRMQGALTRHAESVVLPLLLADSPVVVWWPGAAPDDVGGDALGALAGRRITDAAAATDGATALRTRARTYAPGDTDLAWTRLTPWRTLLASALDQPLDPVRSAVVEAAAGNPSAALLVAWLRRCLGVDVSSRTSRGPGITAVTLHTARGDLAVTRPDGVRAVLSRPGEPDRGVALKRRSTADLLAEELRRLDADEPYAETLLALLPARRRGRTGS